MWKQRLQEKNEELEKVTKKLYLYEKKYQESMLERRDDSQLEQ